ncbi:MAG: sugar phosphate isomerase/epimerase, partial [bacterium]|nr:sugar phosphate isomerase/epimerase [bacterium]
MNDLSRRGFLKATGSATLGLSALTSGAALAAPRKFGVSLAGWSLHRTIGVGDGKTPMLDMPKLARQ